MIGPEGYDGLLSSLYAAVTAPDLWPAAMIDFRDAFGGSATFLQYRAGSREGSVSTLPGASADWETNWAWRNPLSLRGLPAGSVRLDQDLIDRGRLTTTAYYNEFMCPLDIPKILAVTGFSNDRHGAMINIARGRSQPEFERDERELALRLSQHVATALRSAALLGWQAWTELAATIDAKDEAMVVVDAAGAIMHRNPAAQRLADAKDGLTLGERGLGADLRSDLTALQNAIRRAAAAPEPRVGGMVPIQRPSGKRALIAVVTPLPIDTFDLLGPRPRAAITIVDPAARLPSIATDLIGLFGLTRREAEIAAGLAQGLSIGEVAGQIGITVITARNYLNRVLRKTEVTRQSELILLLSRLPRGGGGWR